MSPAVWFIMGCCAAMVLVVGYDLRRSRKPKPVPPKPAEPHPLKGACVETQHERYRFLIRVARSLEGSALVALDVRDVQRLACTARDYRVWAEGYRVRLAAQGFDAPWPPDDEDEEEGEDEEQTPTEPPQCADDGAGDDLEGAGR